MGPKKKPARNAFYFFMLEWKAAREREGQHFKDLDEAAKLCSADWNRLHENARKKYKDMERGAKTQSRYQDGLRCKYNSLGENLQDLENKRLEKEAAITRMQKEIDCTLKNLKKDGKDALQNHFFFLVHANTYCYWGEKKIYIPSEVAVSKFNLKAGVVDTYQVFPAPCTPDGKIPLGYKFEVTLSTAKHSIPDPSLFEEVQYDYNKIRRELFNFLGADSKDDLPPMYTMDGDDVNLNCFVTAVKNFFDYVAEGTFRIYSLNLLFFKLHECCQNIATEIYGDEDIGFAGIEGIAHKQLSRDIYNYCTGISCTFHESTDNYHNCSLSFVKRWAFLLCEFCCKLLRINLIPERHCIKTAQIETVPLTQPQSQPKYKPHSPQQVHSTIDNGNCRNDSEAGAACVVPNIPSRIRNLSLGERLDNPIIASSEPNTPIGVHIKVYQNVQDSIASTSKSEDTLLTLRLPTTRGLGETMARAQQNCSPSLTRGTSFSDRDFPALGERRPGGPTGAFAGGWGRGSLNR